MSFANVYEDPSFAAAYARLDFPGTYQLAFRDLPGLLARYAPGRRALDFGCGAGRSTRFLRGLGYEVVGVDIAPAMLALARAADPGGDYRMLPEGDPLSALPVPLDLVLCAFPFDNTPGLSRKVEALAALGRCLAPGGCIINLCSSAAIYTHEWVSFTTRDYPENARAVSGDPVLIAGRSIPDPRPVTDILWTEAAWQDAFFRAGLRCLEVVRPLARGDEGIPWVSETFIPPWTIHVLTPECAS